MAVEMDTSASGVEGCDTLVAIVTKGEMAGSSFS